MTTNESINSDRQRRLDEAIASYLQLKASGQTPERDQWLALYPDLARELAEFLADDTHETSALREDADQTQDGQSASARELHSQPGMSIAGRFRLEQKLGEGGMGEVWVAQQLVPIKRRVALKLIKLGMDSRAIIARFEGERQALAMMDHPNIAKVLDAGLTQSGAPFFVMELVNGMTLTRFCDESRLTTAQRLELFVQICQGVQHAHQKGIVHRDLKPSNILVTLYDGKPVPKIIDFGVAKATEGKLGDESILTGFGTVVGTLEYMSPEQAGFSGLDIDTRADIYSLGVILYELLTGLRPIESRRFAQAAFAEIVRLICEETPQRPSTRLSSNELLPSLAAVRQVEPRKLTAILRGELDWVVMKCLEKDRSRRYPTANGLSMDIQRYLASEPVQARPPSSAYRLRKFVRRNRVLATVASLFLISLVGGILVTTSAWLQAQKAERKAAREANRAIAVRDFLTRDLLGQANPEQNARGDKITVEQLLDRAADRLKDNTPLTDAPEAKADILAVLADTYTALGNYDKAIEFWKRTVELNQTLSGTWNDERTLDALQGYGKTLMGASNYAEAEKTLRQVVERRLNVSGAEDTQTLFAINNLAIAIGKQGNLAEAERLLKQNWHTRLRVNGATNRDTLQALANYTGLLMEKGDFATAEGNYRQAVDGYRAIGLENIPNAFAAENGLASCLIHQRKLKDAKQLLSQLIERKQRVLGPNHAETLGSRGNRAYVLGELGEIEAAVEDATVVHEGQQSQYGDLHHETLAAKNTLVLALRNAQRWEEAKRNATELVETAKGIKDFNPISLMTYTNNLGWVLEGEQNHVEAERVYRESAMIAAKTGHADHPLALTTAHNLARVLHNQERYQEAYEQGQQALAGRRRTLPPNHPYILATASLVIRILIKLERYDDAENAFQEILSAKPGWTDAQLEPLFVEMARSCLGRQAFKEAVDLLQRSLVVREKEFAGTWQVSEVRSLLGAAFLGAGDLPQAEQTLRLAQEELASASNIAAAEAVAVRQAIRERLAKLEQAKKTAGE